LRYSDSEIRIKLMQVISPRLVRMICKSNELFCLHVSAVQFADTPSFDRLFGENVRLVS
jgi:hypothetical protein